MNISVTLFGQMITFGLFVWFTMRFVWPPMIKALQDRQARIAEGLAAAERGHHDLELAREAAKEKLKVAKQQAVEVIDEAKRQATHLIEGARMQAREDGERIKQQSATEIDMMLVQAKEALRTEVAMLALTSAEKILGHHIDQAAHNIMVDNLIKEI